MPPIRVKANRNGSKRPLTDQAIEAPIRTGIYAAWKKGKRVALNQNQIFEERPTRCISLHHNTVIFYYLYFTEKKSK